ncbi:MAG: hypothetical protein ACRDQ0_02365 [Pseudonocardia sp.]
MNLIFLLAGVAIWLTACEPGRPRTWQDVAMAGVITGGAAIAAWAVAWAERGSK